MHRGLFIALEGIDGSGTTTQAHALKGALEAAGHSVWVTAEPTSGPIGQHIRQVLRDEQQASDATLALLFAADRLEHWSRELEPRLNLGDVVICDRYLLSSLAYQTLQLPMSWVREVNGRAELPDASILLRVSPETAARRRHQRGGPAERFDFDATQRAIADRYLEAFRLPGVGSTFETDAEPDAALVTEQLLRIVLPFLEGTPE